MRILRRSHATKLPIQASRKLGQLENLAEFIRDGGLGVRRVVDGIVEIIPEDTPVLRVTSNALTPIHPNTYRIGSWENYLSDVIAANLTVSSLSMFKKYIRPAEPRDWDIELPEPKRYVRVWSDAEGVKEQEEIGLLAEDMPEHLRNPGGYSVNILLTILTGKIRKIESLLKVLDSKMKEIEKKLG